MNFGPLTAEIAADYARLVETAGWFTRPRTHVELTGADRAKFLHNFCTSEIRKLPEGRGCEAFITTGQGKVFDFILVFAGPESLTIASPPGSGERLVAHLDRYLIREQVELHDRSHAWTEFVVAGPEAAALLTRLGITEPPAGPWGETLVELGGQPVRVRSTAEFGVPAYALVVANESREHVARLLSEAGGAPVDPGVGELLRVEAGFPAYGQDISDKNLPQEVARDDRAISFTKGCYLGQETVARIDALGHVNRTLCP